jgi:hypothetical protein
MCVSRKERAENDNCGHNPLLWSVFSSGEKQITQHGIVCSFDHLVHCARALMIGTEKPEKAMGSMPAFQ